MKYLRHNESLMPIPMGSPARTPYYARKDWGLPLSIDERTVVELYSAEWAMGNQWQLELVREATKRAGFGDYPALLWQKTAEVVRIIVEDHPISGELLILDVGAGPGLSALTIWQELPAAIQPKTRFLLLDPARASLEVAKRIMEGNRINNQIICDVDLNMGQYITEGSIDILIGVAAIHHHSAIPFKLYYKMLKPGGFAVFADWHNSLWEHPARVYRFLQAFDWPQKEVGLRNWLESYPQANTSLPELQNPGDRRANQDITRFWQGYFEIAKQSSDLGPNAIWPLEGHRPVERYVEQMERVGFNLPDITVKGVIRSNPDQILSDSRLLMVTIGEKIWKKERK